MVSEKRYIGGVRRGLINATWPLVRLTISQTGIAIEPSSRLTAPLLRIFGLSDLRFGWADIEAIRPRRSKLPPWLLGNGISFAADGKELIWWATSTANADEILIEIASFVPGKVTPRP
jgi:hypothetical protein